MTAQEIERLTRVETQIEGIIGDISEVKADVKDMCRKLDQVLNVKADKAHVQTLTESISRKADAEAVKALAADLNTQRSNERNALWWAIGILATTGIGTIVYMMQGHISF